MCRVLLFILMGFSEVKGEFAAVSINDLSNNRNNFGVLSLIKIKLCV
ncbi:hypothetical protein M595_0671 [Lyngbya aestuarii BL J]|uniref:Uncharacterized protein n=1 Tax=Lyngbya aestuarii BL J TaxID=1348334 RepID=U7QSC2_9CYAN|nr:hypothetical protein M595_0671 [Lyngbya aestuarii BL J]